MKSIPFVLASFLLTSCGIVLGDLYQPMKVPYEMTVIYVYAGDNLSTPTSVYVDRDGKTEAGDHHILLQPGGYHPVTVPSGHIRVFRGTSGDDGACIGVLAAPNSSHYVRVGSDEDLLELKPATSAARQISQTRRVNSELATASIEGYPLDDCIVH
jgi:hypothetical protein